MFFDKRNNLFAKANIQTSTLIFTVQALQMLKFFCFKEF